MNTINKQTNVMETDTIEKNVASSKSQKNRVNNKLIKFSILFMSMVIVLGCCKKDDLPPVDEQGLTEDVHNIIPDDILEKFIELGIEINGGNTPPNIEEAYLVSADVLVKSNFNDSFVPGHKFSDVEVTFSKQNNTNLTINYDYTTPDGAEEGNGLGAFITGKGDKFSIFVEVSGTLNGHPVKTVQIHSGEISSKGIKNYYWALMNTMEAPNSLKRGQGRLFKDNDGLSERIERNNSASLRNSSSLLLSPLSISDVNIVK